MWPMIPAFAVVLAQAAQPSTDSNSSKWCFDRGRGAELCEPTEDACNRLREVNTQIAKGPCKDRQSAADPDRHTNTQQCDMLGGTMTTYKFSAGEAVKFSPDRGQDYTGGELFEIVRLLPEAGDALQYRIKNQIDGHERVVRQDQLRGA